MADTSKEKPGLTKSTVEPELQKAVDEAEAKGFYGTEVDPTPNERYSLESDDWRTPENDPDAASEVGSKRFAGAAEEAK